MVTAYMVLLGMVVQVVRLFQKRTGILGRVEDREGRSLVGMEAIRCLLVKWRGAIIGQHGSMRLIDTWHISMMLA